jgi:hypothetical protein
MYLFISLLYMFRATQCSSSGETNCVITSSGIYHSVQVTAWYAGPKGALEKSTVRIDPQMQHVLYRYQNMYSATAGVM